MPHNCSTHWGPQRTALNTHLENGYQAQLPNGRGWANNATNEEEWAALASLKGDLESALGLASRQVTMPAGLPPSPGPTPLFLAIQAMAAGLASDQTDAVHVDNHLNAQGAPNTCHWLADGICSVSIAPWVASTYERVRNALDT